MVSLPYSKEKFLGFFMVETLKKLPSNRQKGQAAKAPAWPLTLFPSFPELCPDSWLRSCKGPVPGQMAKMGKIAKEECGKRGIGVGEKQHRPSPQFCLEEEARLGGGGDGKKKSKQQLPPKRRKSDVSFLQLEGGHGGLHSLVTRTLTDVTQAHHDTHFHTQTHGGMHTLASKSVSVYRLLLHLQSHVGQRRKRSPGPCLRENL